MVTPHGNIITESNVHVDSVEITVNCSIKGLNSFCLLWDSADFENVFVIPEYSTSHDTMDLLRHPMNFCIRGVGSIAWTDIRKHRVGMVEKPSNLLQGHSREKDRRFGRDDWGQMRR